MPVTLNGVVIGFLPGERCERCSPIEAALERHYPIDHEGLKAAMIEVVGKMQEAGACGALCVPLIKIWGEPPKAMGMEEKV